MPPLHVVAPLLLYLGGVNDSPNTLTCMEISNHAGPLMIVALSIHCRNRGCVVPPGTNLDFSSRFTLLRCPFPGLQLFALWAWHYTQARVINHLDLLCCSSLPIAPTHHTLDPIIPRWAHSRVRGDLLALTASHVVCKPGREPLPAHSESHCVKRGRNRAHWVQNSAPELSTAHLVVRGPLCPLPFVHCRSPRSPGYQNLSRRSMT